MFKIPLYTIHHKANHAPLVFHIENVNTQEYKPFLLGFERKKNAYVMAKMLEGHRIKHDSWPPMEISREASFRVDSNTDYHKNKMPNLYVHEWETHQRFTEFVTHYMASVMIMMIDDDKKIRTSFLQFEYPPEFVKHKLTLMD